MRFLNERRREQQNLAVCGQGLREDESERSIHLHYGMSFSSKMTKTDDSDKSTMDRLQRYDELIGGRMIVSTVKIKLR